MGAHSWETHRETRTARQAGRQTGRGGETVRERQPSVPHSSALTERGRERSESVAARDGVRV